MSDGEHLEGYVVHPCSLIGTDGTSVTAQAIRETYQECSEDDPHLAVWAVYARISGKLTWFADFPDRDLAFLFRLFLQSIDREEGVR